MNITVITECDTLRQETPAFQLLDMICISSIIDLLFHLDSVIVDLKSSNHYEIYYCQESTISNRKQLSQIKEIQSALLH